jgi:acyl-CoA reductase-like NAD-dependent aldehyde dehydrogenase
MTVVERPRLGFLEKPMRLFIGGEWVDGADSFETRDPATGEVLAEIPIADSGHIDAAVAAARSAYNDGWRDMAPTERQKLMWRLGDLLDDHKEEFAILEVLDNGKPLWEAELVDIALSVEILRYYAGWPTKIHGDVLPNSIPGLVTLRKREPVGVVGAIAPWNFPLLEIMYKIGPALAAGCTLVCKPASWTPLTTLRFGELVNEAGIPPGVINILTGPGKGVGSGIAGHPGIDKVAFTGQTETGQEILRQAIPDLKRVSLELGGKSPNVVFADAQRDAALAGAFGAIFFNQGQACVAGSRLFVEDVIADQFVSDLIEKAKAIKLGQGLNRDVEMGPLVSASHRDTVKGYIEQADGGGAQIVAGGKEAIVEGLEGGYFLEPTVVDGVTNEMSIAQEEIFGPVVSVIRFSEWDELISLSNDVRYGLAAGVWTSDVNKALKYADAVQAGTVWINTYGMFDVSVPFGGRKMSGFGGRELGEEALDAYLQAKSIWIDLEAAIPTQGQGISR